MGNWGLSLLDKLNISEEILANPNNKALLKQYYDDYVDGLENISEALAEYRRLLMGGKKVASEKINDSPDEFDIEKVMNLVEKLKKTKPIDPALKKEGEIIIMNESIPYKNGEIDRVLSSASAKYTKNGKLKSKITEELYDEEDDVYYIHIIISKNGKIKMKKEVSDDRTIFD